ncbi:MAG: hypothetical protein MK165_09450 [Pirellulaceae bacterium]|nr:hypothetical protein [Pirellulaceae bacterium]
MLTRCPLCAFQGPDGFQFPGMVGSSVLVEYTPFDGCRQEMGDVPE